MQRCGRLARAGYDVYRDHLNTPAFFQMLPDVTNLRGLELGCGEGYNTRLLALAKAPGSQPLTSPRLVGKYRPASRSGGSPRNRLSCGQHRGASVRGPHIRFRNSFHGLHGHSRSGAVGSPRRSAFSSRVVFCNSPFTIPVSVRRIDETYATRTVQRMPLKSVRTFATSTVHSTNGSSALLQTTSHSTEVQNTSLYADARPMAKHA